MEGWIKLHRKITEHPFWKEKRTFSRLEAWEDILMSANYKYSKDMVKGQLIEFRRGEWHTSELKLCSRWGWSRNRVRAYLRLLAEEKMITQKGTANGTTLTVVNYGFYQCDDTAEGTPESTPDGTTESTPEGTPEGTQTKKVKKERKKEGKEVYAEFVTLTVREYEKLCDEYMKTGADEMIVILNNYKASSGKRYKSDYHTILGWVKDKWLKERGTPKAKQMPRGFASLMEDDVIDI